MKINLRPKIEQETFARIAMVTLVLILLAFNILDRIDLGKASNQRFHLITEIADLQKKIDSLENSDKKNKDIIQKLQTLILQENALIIKLGGVPIPIPDGSFSSSQQNPSSNPESQPSPTLTPRPHSSTVPPSATPKPSKSPSPTPLINPCAVTPIPFIC